jgi:CubicO group peptidase (beta-lactamase class C family)
VLLSLAAEGRFDLDDDIDQYLDFEVRNPNHPDTPITFRQLLRHRSSIADNAVIEELAEGGGNGGP